MPRLMRWVSLLKYGGASYTLPGVIPAARAAAVVLCAKPMIVLA